MRVLYAEDNPSLARATSAIFRKSGFEVEVASDGGEALEMLRGGYYDVAVLDIMMPVMDGLEVLRRARAEGNDVPVIMLTAKTQVDDKVAGLDLGANDYVTKPYDARELVARVRAAGRPRSGAAARVTWRDVTIETESLELVGAKGTLRVDPREAKLAAALAHAGGKVVGSSWLVERVWEGDAMEGTLDLYAQFLNGKLKAVGSTVRVEGSDEAGWRLVSADGAAS